MQLISSAQVEVLQSVAEALQAKGLSEESRALRGVVSAVRGSSDEYSAPEAAEILGVTPQTIRNWVRGSVIPGRRDATRHYWVPKQALAGAVALRAASPEQAVDVIDEEIDAEIAAVRAARRTCDGHPRQAA